MKKTVRSRTPVSSDIFQQPVEKRNSFKLPLDVKPPSIAPPDIPSSSVEKKPSDPPPPIPSTFRDTPIAPSKSPKDEEKPKGKNHFKWVSVSTFVILTSIALGWMIGNKNRDLTI